jgi:Tfp pilus assembly protein PilO
LIPAAIVVIVAGWFFLAYIPFNNTIKEYTKQRMMLENKDKLSISDLRVQVMEVELDSLAISLEQNMSRLYSEDQLLDLGRVIDGIGKQYGLTLVTITPDYKVLPRLIGEQEKITVFPMTITFSGTFRQFTKFLDNISNFPIVFQAESISLTKEEGSGLKITGEMRCKIVMRKKGNDDNSESQLAMTDQT